MKRACLLALIIICATTSAHAYSAAERQFCWPEVKRLCSIGQITEAALGHYGGIQACFAAHHSEISRACVDAIHKAHGKKAKN